MPPANENPAAPLDADGRVGADRNCVTCGYNLRTLPADGVCPECATPVMYSLRDWLLQFASAPWLQRLSRGLLLLIIFVVATIAIGLISAAIGMAVAFSALASGGTPATLPNIPVWLTILPTLVGMALLFWGLWLFSTAEPRPGPPSADPAARKGLRVAIWIVPVQLVVSLVWVFTPWSVMWSPLGAAVTAVWGVASTAIMVLLAVLVMGHLRVLMRRVPRVGLARFARIEFWGLLVTGTLLIIGQAFTMGTTARMTSALGAANLSGSPWQTGALPFTQIPAPSSGPSTPAPLGAQRTRAGPATAPTTTLPVGFPAVGGLSYWISAGVQSCAGCAGSGFAIAGFVLVILAQRVLAGVAARAATNMPPEAGA
jgi:hypothetical protein